MPVSATNNLRAHLRRKHGLALAPTPVGRLTQAEKDQAMAWYAGLFVLHEQEEEDEDEEEEEAEEDGEEEEESEEESEEEEIKEEESEEE